MAVGLRPTARIPRILKGRSDERFRSPRAAGGGQAGDRLGEQDGGGAGAGAYSEVGGRGGGVGRASGGENTTGGAGRWWEEMETENEHRLDVVPRRAEERASREATTAGFFPRTLDFK